MYLLQLVSLKYKLFCSQITNTKAREYCVAYLGSFVNNNSSLTKIFVLGFLKNDSRVVLNKIFFSIWLSKYCPKSSTVLIAKILPMLIKNCSPCWKDPSSSPLCSWTTANPNLAVDCIYHPHIVLHDLMQPKALFQYIFICSFTCYML